MATLSTRQSRLQFARDLATVIFSLIILLLLAFPFIWVVLISFRPDRESFSRTFRLITSVTLDNYYTLLENSPFPS